MDSESTAMDKIELEPLKKDSEDSDQDEDPEIRDEDDIEKESVYQDDVDKGYDDGYYGPAQPLVIVPLAIPQQQQVGQQPPIVNQVAQQHPQQPQTQVVHVVNQRQAEPVQRFAEYPARVDCPHCKQSVMTRVELERSTQSLVISGVLCFMLCWPCALFAYHADGLKRADHFCPECEKFITDSNQYYDDMAHYHGNYGGRHRRHRRRRFGRRRFGGHRFGGRRGSTYSLSHHSMRSIGPSSHSSIFSSHSL